MKLIKTTSILLSFLTNSISADREYLGLLPFNNCGPITTPQKGFWVDRGEVTVSNSKLRFSEECENEGTNNGKCVIHCAGFTQRLIMDRQKEGGWDRSMGGDDQWQKKYLVKCKCQTYQEDDGTITTENCEWKPRRYWKEKEYREEYELGNKGEGEEPWVQPTHYPENAEIIHLRKKRGLQEPRMKFYCEDEVPDHIADNLNIKPHDLGINKAVRKHRDNKDHPFCGNMYELFPNAGGEWTCRMNVTDPNTGETYKQVVDATNVPHTAICSWGCTEGNQQANNDIDYKDARFSCERPWHARPSTKFELTEIWRRFTGFGTRVYKRGMLKCVHYDDTLRK